MDIIGKKNWYFLISAIVIVPGLLSLLFWHLNYGIDFTGGSELEFAQNKSATIDVNALKQVFTKDKVTIDAIKPNSENDVTLRTAPLPQATNQKLIDDVKKKNPNIVEKSFETIGPTIGSETESNAIKAVLIASLAIMIFIAYVFRKVSRPVSSWKFGVCAVAALLHDVLVVVGIFSLLGHFFGVEVDSLFITALLTVMGFSVHDTIVVFDRIRENLMKNVSHPFEQVVNESMLETFNRSLNTSLTVLVVLFSLLLFGGASIRWFVVALLIGILSGTYSSIFNASPLLVLWYEWDRKHPKKKK